MCNSGKEQLINDYIYSRIIHILPLRSTVFIDELILLSSKLPVLSIMVTILRSKDYDIYKQKFANFLILCIFRKLKFNENVLALYDISKEFKLIQRLFTNHLPQKINFLDLSIDAKNPTEYIDDLLINCSSPSDLHLTTNILPSLFPVIIKSEIIHSHNYHRYIEHISLYFQSNHLDFNYFIKYEKDSNATIDHCLNILQHVILYHRIDLNILLYVVIADPDYFITNSDKFHKHDFLLPIFAALTLTKVESLDKLVPSLKKKFACATALDSQSVSKELIYLFLFYLNKNPLLKDKFLFDSDLNAKSVNDYFLECINHTDSIMFKLFINSYFHSALLCFFLEENMFHPSLHNILSTFEENACNINLILKIKSLMQTSSSLSHID